MDVIQGICFFWFINSLPVLDSKSYATFLFTRVIIVRRSNDFQCLASTSDKAWINQEPLALFLHEKYPEIRNEPQHDKTNKMSVCPAKTIRLGIGPVWSVLAVRMKKARVLSYPYSAQRRLWSEGAHSFCWFCHVKAPKNSRLWVGCCQLLTLKIYVQIKLQAMQDAPPLQLYPASDIKGKLQSTCKVSKGLA